MICIGPRLLQHIDKPYCIWISKVKELDKFDSIFSFEIVNLHVILNFEELKHPILQIKMLAKEV